MSVEQGRFLARQIPNARYIELHGDEHLPFVGNDRAAILAEVEHFLTGATPAPAQSRILATLLVTEIVGAMAIAARLGDDHRRAVVDTYDRLARQLLTRFRGRGVRRSIAGVLTAFRWSRPRHRMLAGAD